VEGGDGVLCHVEPWHKMEVKGLLNAVADMCLEKYFHWIGGWVRPTANLDALVKIKIRAL
jgi:hypothetical protein